MKLSLHTKSYTIDVKKNNNDNNNNKDPQNA